MAIGAFKAILDGVDRGVEQFVFHSYAGLADKMSSTLKLMFTLFFVTYGISWMMGWIPGTIQDFMKNIIRMLFIVTFSTQWDIFESTIYPIVTNAPDQIAAAILGSTGQFADSSSANEVLGDIYDNAIASAGEMMYGSDTWDFATKLTGLAVGAVSFAMSIYAVGLIVLAKIATAVLLGMAPVFVALMTFPATRGLFEGWFRQLLNYMFIPLITYGVIIFVALLNKENATNLYTAATGGSATEEPAYALLLSTGVSILLLAQVSGIASGIAGGMQLSTLSPVAAATRNAFRNMGLNTGAPTPPTNTIQNK